MNRYLKALGIGAVALVAAVGGFLVARATLGGGQVAAPGTGEGESARGEPAPGGENAEPDPAGSQTEGELVPPAEGVEVPPAEGDEIPVDGLVELEPTDGAEYAFFDPEGERTTGTTPPPTLPVVVRLSSLTGLRDGSPITIRAEAKPGFEFYGFDARICRQGSRIRNNFDFMPSVGASCIANPLAAGTDAHLQVASAPPHRIAEGTFRVATGTDRFRTEWGEDVSITCDRANPCELVLQLQVPYGFGYQRYLLEFA